MISPQPLPLSRANRILLARAFRHVPRVDLSLECVIEDQMGHAVVDDPESPTVFKNQIGPFAYFAGDPTTPAGQQLLDTLEPYTLLMAAAPGWAAAVQEKFGDQLLAIDRYTFSSDTLTGKHLQTIIDKNVLRYPIKRMDEAFVARLWNQEHFIHFEDYESPADFCRRGIGYFSKKDNQIIGAAYASLVCSKGIEISIFVEETFRRQRIALVLASHLLHWCLANSVHPNWDAANEASCRLAEKLGYRPLGSYKAFYRKAR